MISPDFEKNPPLILVVDDDKTVRFVLRRAMEKKGYHIAEAADGEQCLASCKQLKPDLVLLDAMLPEMDGFTCCAQLLSLLGNECPAVLMITTLNDKASVDQAFEVGATDYITKPINWPLLQMRLRRLLESRWAMTQLLQRTKELITTNATLQTEITERQQAESALRSSLATNRALLNAIPDLMLRLSKDGTFVDFKAAKDNNLLVSSSEFLSKNLDEVLPIEMAQPTMYYMEQALQTGKIQIFESQLLMNNSLLDYETRIVVSAEDEVMAIVRDVTERKQAEKQIKASLKEKEVLLKEIHHRVKNNLQIISSLLKLQSRSIKDEQTLAMFNESQSRIRTMALIHESLYQSNDLSRINFAEYIQKLVANLLRSYEINSSAIKPVINVDNVFLEIDVAVPCGLIINELVSNSLKYAFPSGKEGKIQVDFSSENERNFTLSVSDNGVGLPKNLNILETKTLGLQLVNNLVDQLEGTVKNNVDGGTEFRITFSI